MQNVSIIIFDEDELTATLVKNYLSGLTFISGVKNYNEFNPELLQECKSAIVIVNISSNDNDIFNKIKCFSENKYIKIIATSYNTSANLQVKAFRAGAKDFLAKPLIKSDFVNTVQNLYNKYFYSNSAVKSSVFTAISNKKGAGKSVFLINLAKELADISNENVLLLDFNNSQDNISFMLNADIAHNTNYYINNLTQDNAQVLIATVNKYKNSTLYIMANTFTKNKSFSVKKDKLNNTLNILKQHFRYILVDKTPDESDIEDETLINFSDEVFCIVLPFISSFDKIKDVLDNYYKNKNVKIILNQYTNEDFSKIEQIQYLLGREIFWKIPKNYTAVNNAMNNKMTLKEAAEGTDIVNVYEELAKYLAARD